MRKIIFWGLNVVLIYSCILLFNNDIVNLTEDEIPEITNNDDAL